MNIFNIIFGALASMPVLWVQGMCKNMGTVNDFFILSALKDKVKKEW
jgi:hypothetical protein|tara:strand:- start:542 stop:682 length:141 start_codon:yes stop_codon:yes gene_type:complete